MATVKQLRVKAKVYKIEGYSKMDTMTLEELVSLFEQDNPQISKSLMADYEAANKKKSPKMVKVTGSLNSEEGMTAYFDDGHTEHFHAEIAPDY